MRRLLLSLFYKGRERGFKRLSLIQVHSGACCRATILAQIWGLLTGELPGDWPLCRGIEAPSAGGDRQGKHSAAVEYGAQMACGVQGTRSSL